MIQTEKYKILMQHLTTLKETSKDDHDGTICYMTESLIPVINFDAVKDEYILQLSVSKPPKSNDALYIDSYGKATFIEFKNGYMNKAKQFDVRKKIYDSLLIFSDIVGLGISYTRAEMDYILVYNESKNNPTEDEQKMEVQVSPSRDSIARSIMKLGALQYVKFGLDIFQSYCFHNVYTYTEEEFEEYFINTLPDKDE